MIPIYLLKRYKLQSKKVQSELQRLHQWTEVLPIGQYPASYHKALDNLIRYNDTKLLKTWEKIRSYILPDGKTLWQHLPYVDHNSLPPFELVNKIIEDATNAVADKQTGKEGK